MFKNLIFFLVLNSIIISNSFSQIFDNLKVNGNQRLSIETIKVIGNIDLTKNYDDEDLNNLIKELYRSDYFQDISINIENKTLILNLKENPIIEGIQIIGLKKKSIADELLKQISLKNRKPYKEYFLDNDIILIKNILKSIGFYFAKVSPSIIKDDELGTVKILLNIDQGKKAKVKNISFIGDKKLKDKKLLEIIASEEHKFWKFISNKIYLNQSRINLDVRLLENYYQNLGYYDVKILNSFAELNNNGDFNLIYNIDAGNIFYFNKLELKLPDNYVEDDFKDIKNELTKLSGKKYSVNDLNNILNSIEKIASLRLYDFVDAKVNEEIIDNNKIDFSFNINDSTSSYVEKINILGNYTTIEEVIRNKLIVDEGDPLNKILFNKSLDNIRSLRIFKNVDAEIKEGSNQKLKIIDINVEEMPTGEISLAAGVGSSGTTIGGGIVEKNFLGKGINLDTNLEISESSIKGEFIYSKPNFAYTDNTLNTSLFSTTTDNLSDYGYKVSSLGFSLGTEFEQYENFYFSPSVDVSVEDLTTNSSASNNLKNQKGNYNDMYFNYGLNYDLRNSKFNTSEGIITSFYQQLPLLSDGKEIINSIGVDMYKPITRNSDLITKSSFYFKAVNSIDSDKDVRISKRANVPYNRLRGFEKGKIGPIDNNDYIGGNYVSTINFSTNLPFLLPSLEAFDFLYFVDVANIWGVDYNKSIDDSNTIRSSTGLGLNVVTPVGPLSFSLTQPITKKDTDKTEKFRFNLGTSF